MYINRSSPHHTNECYWEVVARAWDPVGWKWYDGAVIGHLAKPMFYEDQRNRAMRVIQQAFLIQPIKPTFNNVNE